MSALSLFVWGLQRTDTPLSRLDLLFQFSDSLLMWCSCLRQQGQDKKHEDDKNCKTNPKSNHNGIWWKRENKMISISPTHAESFLPHAAWLQAPKDFAAYYWVAKRKDDQIYCFLFLNRKLPLKVSFLAQILLTSGQTSNKLKEGRHWILLVSKIRATPFMMPGPSPSIALETISVLEIRREDCWIFSKNLCPFRTEPLLF